MVMKDALRIAGVCERDIDLLLLEEFIASPSFRSWFVAASGMGDLSLGAFLGADRSVTHFTGESDLEVRFADNCNGMVVLLVENKIGAALQPQQSERYHERGADYVEKGLCTRYRTVIVGPEAYFVSPEQTRGFQHRLDYEALIEWFDRAEALGARRSYKSAMLRSAIEKATFGYQAVADAAVTDFFQAYWLIATELAPSIGMRKPKGRPSGSGRVYFRTPEIVALQADVAHKTAKGIVDLHLRGRGHRVGAVQSRLSPILAQDMTVEPAQGSAAVRIHVPKLDRQLPADGQLEKIKLALNAAQRLSDWAIQHQAIIIDL